MSEAPIFRGAFRLDAEVRTLKALIRELLADLPQQRDWLNPALEAELRAHVKS